MNAATLHALPLVAGLALLGCATVPAGPDVMVLPGSGKTFDAFRLDDAVCRSFAAQQTGLSPQAAAAGSAATGAAVGAGLGAAAGAAIGAASGHPGAGAAVGAGSGLLLGSAGGAAHGHHRAASLQSRYDAAYMQCMYAKGNQIPVARSSVAGPAPPRPAPVRRAPPPPPAGPPPPPPPDIP